MDACPANITGFLVVNRILDTSILCRFLVAKFNIILFAELDQMGLLSQSYQD